VNLKNARCNNKDTGLVGFEDGKWVEVDGSDNVACFGGTIRLFFKYICSATTELIK
jgi:hypothetical protein